MEEVVCVGQCVGKGIVRLDVSASGSFPLEQKAEQLVAEIYQGIKTVTSTCKGQQSEQMSK